MLNSTMKDPCKHFLLSFTALLSAAISVAQPEPPSDLNLEDLRVWLKNNWHTGYHHSLGYNQARMQMYGYIDNFNGEIECVYTGFTQDGGYVTYPNPINAEHIVPQSFFGSSEPMKSDIYILKPCHGNANSSRSNYPYGEVNNSQAQWYGVIGNTYTSQDNQPSDHEFWSEKSGNVWEPREEHKGNIARSIFYFYTMYPDEVGDISQIGDPETLYQWHLDDPIDSEELDRNDKVETHQGNRNPYVDYPDLVWDAWFHEEAAVDTDGPAITGASVVYIDCEDYPTSDIFITATDETDPLTITFVDSGSEDGCEFSIIRTYVAVDGAGNTTTFTQELSVMDMEAPTFTSFPNDLVVTCGDDYELVEPLAIDNCSATTMMATETILGEACPSGHQIIRTYTVVDECGNTTTATQNIIVNEYIEPIGCSSDLNNDGFITVNDILLSLSEFGCPSGCNYDVDGDGIVGVGDILGILADYGSAC